MLPPTNSSVTSQPLPPLPDLSSQPQGADSSPGQPPSFLSSIIAGLAPVKHGVDSINSACQQIVQSGVPGAAQVCGQIIALANSLLPMAAQSALQPGGMVGAGSPGGLSAPPPPPGMPPPVGAGPAGPGAGATGSIPGIGQG